MEEIILISKLKDKCWLFIIFQGRRVNHGGDNDKAP